LLQAEVRHLRVVLTKIESRLDAFPAAITEAIDRHESRPHKGAATTDDIDDLEQDHKEDIRELKNDIKNQRI